MNFGVKMFVSVVLKLGEQIRGKEKKKKKKSRAVKAPLPVAALEAEGNMNLMGKV